MICCELETFSAICAIAEMHKMECTARRRKVMLRILLELIGSRLSGRLSSE